VLNRQPQRLLQDIATFLLVSDSPPMFTARIHFGSMEFEVRRSLWEIPLGESVEIIADPVAATLKHR
jgi:hypothetical protein